MFVMMTELAGALKAARMFASEDVTRPNLNCVHFEAVEGGADAGSGIGRGALRMVSTDGHTLWACEVPARDVAAADHTWNVPLAEVDRILRALKGAPPEVELSLAKRTLHGAEYAARGDEAQFPPYGAVVPYLSACVPGKVLPEFAAEYVARCCDALAAYGKGFAPEVPKKGLKKADKEKARNTANAFLSPAITWRLAGELDPAIFFSPKFPTAFAIVMPRRGEGGKVSVADFLGRLKTEKRKAA